MVEIGGQRRRGEREKGDGRGEKGNEKRAEISLPCRVINKSRSLAEPTVYTTYIGLHTMCGVKRHE